MIDLETVILVVLATLTAGFGLRFMWTIHRPPARRTISQMAVDPITGARDRIAIYDSDGSFIAMPSHLKTRDEMVAWMTQELPRLTAAQPNNRT